MASNNDALITQITLIPIFHWEKGIRAWHVHSIPTKQMLSILSIDVIFEIA